MQNNRTATNNVILNIFTRMNDTAGSIVDLIQLTRVQQRTNEFLALKIQDFPRYL